MTQREFVAIFAVACAVFAASAEMIDVLSLGAKNDGSEIYVDTCYHASLRTCAGRQRYRNVRETLDK